MFCYQCEQTSKGEGCQTVGVCGKDATTAALEDLLIHAIKGVSMYAHRAHKLGAADAEIDAFTIQAVFATLTNVNFDPERLVELIHQAVAIRDRARSLYERVSVEAGVVPSELGGAAAWTPAATPGRAAGAGAERGFARAVFDRGQGDCEPEGVGALRHQGRGRVCRARTGAGRRRSAVLGEDSRGAGLFDSSGADGRRVAGRGIGRGRVELPGDGDSGQGPHGNLWASAAGEGQAPCAQGEGDCGFGHDLHDLYALLEQTKGLGIQIYTHGEMLPAHGYPKLKAFEHLAGNYGGAWVDQAHEFADFPGAILMTSNCIQEPKVAYKQRMFTSGAVAWPGVKHIADQDFSEVIAAALRAPGYLEDGSDEEITVGFGHNAVLSVADRVIDAVKTGAIRHFFLIGGCDGARSGRSYYTELAESIPEDCVIMTLACGKFRFNKLEFGEIGGLPRLLDVGQCNDTYSALQIALALGKAFDCGVNELPLSLVLSWYEQKAVAVLLTLLHLGVRNIRIGPTLPAFLSPAVLALLHEKFNLMAITNAEQDLAAMLA